MNGIVNNEAILSMVPNETHVAKEGYFVVHGGAYTGAGGGDVATLVTSATATRPIGVIIDGGYLTQSDSSSARAVSSRKSTVATYKHDGVVLVRVGGTPGSIAAGSRLMLDVGADGRVALDAGTGARIVVAQALASNNNVYTAGTLIPAILLQPEYYSS